MLSYCLKCRKNTKSKNSKNARTQKQRIMILSKCAVWDSKKRTFINQREAIGLLSSLRIKVPLSKFPSVGPLLF